MRILDKVKAIILLKIRGYSGVVPTSQLIKMGMKVGKNFKRVGNSIIDDSHCWLITIGDNVSLAPNVHILAHDGSTKMFLGYTRIGPVEIGDNVVIASGTIILPNIKIGSNVIVGAGSVVTKSVPDGTVVAGNPARFICSIDEFIEKNRKLIGVNPTYDENWTTRGKISARQKNQMIDDLKSGIGYVQ
jgi:maltose O-acetyltransferase